MWWSSRPIVLLLLAGLGGCGFKPLYGTSSIDPGVSGELAAVRVAGLPDRQGQLVRNAVVERLSPLGEPERPRFVLRLQVNETEVPEAIQTDATATRDVVTYSVSYQLFQGDTEIDAGRFRRVLSYDYLDQHYSDISSQRDVEARAADEIGEELQLELATYFMRDAEMKAARAGS